MVDPFLSYLDDLKARRDWNDAELADRIGLPNRQYLHKIRKGEADVSTEVKIQVWDLLGYAWTRDVALSLLPKKFSERLRAVDNKRNRPKPKEGDSE
jgi:hypothetical protein